MLESLLDIIDACRKCKVHKGWREKFKITPIPPTFAFHTVSIDSIGPLPCSKKGNRWILVAIDNFTRWVEALAVTANTDSITAAFITNQVIYRHGCPQNLLHDNGTNYVSKLVSQVKEAMGIHGILAAPYHPQTNGAVERVNGTLLKILCCLSNKTTEWDEYLPAALMAYRLTPHSATGHSPFKLLYGREPALPNHLLPFTLDFTNLDYDSMLNTLVSDIVTLQATGWERTKAGHQILLNSQDPCESAYPIYKIEDKVLAYISRSTQKRAHKLGAVWEGPFTIIHRRHNEYAIKHDKTGIVTNRVHSRFLRAYLHPREKQYIEDPTTSSRSGEMLGNRQGTPDDFGTSEIQDSSN